MGVESRAGLPDFKGFLHVFFLRGIADRVEYFYFPVFCCGRSARFREHKKEAVLSGRPL